MPERIVPVIAGKSYIIATVMIIFSSALRYVQALKRGEDIRFIDMLSFLLVASAIVLSVLGLLHKLGYEIDPLPP